MDVCIQGLCLSKGVSLSSSPGKGASGDKRCMLAATRVLSGGALRRAGLASLLQCVLEGHVLEGRVFGEGCFGGMAGVLARCKNVLSSAFQRRCNIAIATSYYVVTFFREIPRRS